MRYLTFTTLCLPLFCVALALNDPAFPAFAAQAQSVSPSQTVDEATVQDPEEYAVLNALLAQSISGPDHESFLIKEHTAVLGLPGVLHAYSYLSEAAYSDFHAKNEKSYILDAKFTGTPAWTLLSKETEDKLFPFANLTSITGETAKKIDEAWEHFYQIYPSMQGILTLSRVGFNSDKSQAAVYVRYDGNVMSSHGEYFVLVRKIGSWEVQTKKLVFIALKVGGSPEIANSALGSACVVARA
jgi:hypothetical protein